MQTLADCRKRSVISSGTIRGSRFVSEPQILFLQSYIGCRILLSPFYWIVSKRDDASHVRPPFYCLFIFFDRNVRIKIHGVTDLAHYYPHEKLYRESLIYRRGRIIQQSDKISQ